MTSLTYSFSLIVKTLIIINMPHRHFVNNCLNNLSAVDSIRVSYVDFG